MAPTPERFPDWDGPEAEASEWGELRALGEELQSCVPVEAPTSEDFSQELHARLEERPWELRTALRERPLLRAAAALLMISTVAAPVSALVLLLRPVAEDRPALTFEPPVALPDFVEEFERPEDPTVPPNIPGFEELFDADWQAAVARSNRAAVMIAQWHEAQQALPTDDASAQPARTDWADASRAELQAEFVRRARLGVTSALPASLVERLEAEFAAFDLTELPAELRAFQWMLHGQGPPPVPQVFVR